MAVKKPGRMTRLFGTDVICGIAWLSRDPY
jgi:hypothetical protein